MAGKVLESHCRCVRARMKHSFRLATDYRRRCLSETKTKKTEKSVECNAGENAFTMVLVSGIFLLVLVTDFAYSEMVLVAVKYAV